MQFREGARLGDVVEVRSSVRSASPFRLVFQQDVWKPSGSRPMVECEIELVTVDAEGRPVAVPESVRSRVAA
jgi:acyl-CoA thioesterase FadM